MMAEHGTLADSKIIAFAPTTDYGNARKFYEGVLGLRLLEDEQPFALVFEAGGTMLRVTEVSAHAPAPFTVLAGTWRALRLSSWT